MISSSGAKFGPSVVAPTGGPKRPSFKLDSEFQTSPFGVHRKVDPSADSMRIYDPYGYDQDRQNAIDSLNKARAPQLRQGYYAQGAPKQYTQVSGMSMPAGYERTFDSVGETPFSIQQRASQAEQQTNAQMADWVNMPEIGNSEYNKYVSGMEQLKKNNASYQWAGITPFNYTNPFYSSYFMGLRGPTWSTSDSSGDRRAQVQNARLDRQFRDFL